LVTDVNQVGDSTLAQKDIVHQQEHVDFLNAHLDLWMKNPGFNVKLANVSLMQPPPYHRVINTTRNSDDDMAAKSQIPLQLFLVVHTRKSLKNVNLNYSIQINFETVNVNQIVSPSSYGKDAFTVRFESAKIECVFLDEINGNFSKYGIETLNRWSLDYKCYSNHTTIFASLLTLSVVIYPLALKVRYRTE